MYIIRKILNILIKIIDFIKKNKKTLLLVLGFIFILEWSYHKINVNKINIIMASDYPGVSMHTFDNTFSGKESDIIKYILHNKDVIFDNANVLQIKSLVKNGDYLIGCGFIINEDDGCLYSLPIIKNVSICEVSSSSRGRIKSPWKEGDIVIMPKIYMNYCKKSYTNVKYFDSVQSAIDYFQSERKSTKLIIDSIVYMYYYDDIFQSHALNILNDVFFDLCAVCYDEESKIFLNNLLTAYDISINIQEEFENFYNSKIKK